ncbi:glycosyltransferase [Sulfurimonas sp. HSL3-7]|uniref:glycosyltransferase n=1 Tax=Sulfonitrofixus jiaomeiensis TaxID=3131938 RepID=UPI0031F8C04F
MKKGPKKILIIGPCLNRKNPELAGGPIVFFEGFIKQLDKNSVQYNIIDTNKKNYCNLFSAYINIFFQILFKQRGCSHISLHSSRDYMILGIIIIFIGKIFKKRTSIRKFGAEVINTYKESKRIKKYVLKFIFSHIDTLFLQTKYLVDFFSKINENTFWFPNVRSRVIEPTLPRSFQKRFVFVSHVIREKGIDEIIEASNQLDRSYTIDIFGPIFDEKYTEEYFEEHNVSYNGALKADNVMQKLNEYDVVLLPSYKEGYPGIVIEAYSLGIPVIVTALQPIKEIVDPFETGILIEPKSVEELVNAIKYFNENNYSSMSENAYRKFENFDFDKQIKKFLERI